MRMRNELSFPACLLALVGWLSGPAIAETAPADCDALAAKVEAVIGYNLTAPPAASVEGWCVMDGSVLRPEVAGGPRINATRLRIRGATKDDRLTSLSLDVGGLRISPALGDRDMDARLRSALQLQTADLWLTLEEGSEAEGLRLLAGKLALSGGTEVIIGADIAGLTLTSTSLLPGRVTKLNLEWKNDGRLLRPAMEAWGERLEPGATGTKAVLAVRSALLRLVEAMPESSLLEGAPEGAEEFVAALPQGRGRLVLALESEGGIGAAQLGLLALSDDPTGPAAMARFFAGTMVSVSWMPGIAP